jgi:glutamine amidotransferase
MIAIIDYGLGNVMAFRNIFERLNIPACLARTADDLAGATKVILPGVGAFDQAMERFDRSGMRDPVERLALERKLPLLGVCVGMQMLGESSEEGTRAGLGWVPGSVRRLTGPSLALPHMGWNDVAPVTASPLFDRMDGTARFYFLHSYHFVCRDPGDVLASCDYAGGFACALKKENILGVQFHPEKSHHWGTQLLANFARA